MGSTPIKKEFAKNLECEGFLLKQDPCFNPNE